MTFDRDRTLSEFVDAWTAGRRPDVDDFIARAPEDQQGALADALMSFLSFAPTPEYSDAALEAIRAEAIVAGVTEAADAPGGLLPVLLVGLRRRFSLSTPQLAAQLAPMLDLTDAQVEKTSSYLHRLEHGELETARVSRRVFDALARLFGVPRDQLEGAADTVSWGPRPMMAAGPLFRADEDAAEAVGPHLELLADALQTPGADDRDAVDDLFLGGR